MPSRNVQASSTAFSLTSFPVMGGVSRYLKKRGFLVVSIDITDDPRLDVLDPAVVAVLVGWIKSKCVLGVWLATPAPHGVVLDMVQSTLTAAQFDRRIAHTVSRI